MGLPYKKAKGPRKENMDKYRPAFYEWQDAGGKVVKYHKTGWLKKVIMCFELEMITVCCWRVCKWEPPGGGQAERYPAPFALTLLCFPLPFSLHPSLQYIDELEDERKQQKAERRQVGLPFGFFHSYTGAWMRLREESAKAHMQAGSR